MGAKVLRTGVVLVLVAMAVVFAVDGGAAAGADPSPAQSAATADVPTHQPPPGALILFDGTDLRQWSYLDGRPAGWKIENGVMVIAGGNVITKEQFADAYIHVEFREPDMPEASGQAKGNSGVYMQGRYEVQVLDSYGIKSPGKGDCGAIYGEYAPLVNACKPPLKWQSYDIIFRAPRFDASGAVVQRPRMTVLQNGILIQNNVEVSGPTVAALDATMVASGPLMLQDHGCPVQYRNIWVVRLPAQGSDTYEPR